MERMWQWSMDSCLSRPDKTSPARNATLKCAGDRLHMTSSNLQASDHIPEDAHAFERPALEPIASLAWSCRILKGHQLSSKPSTSTRLCPCKHLVHSTTEVVICCALLCGESTVGKAKRRARQKGECRLPPLTATRDWPHGSTLLSYRQPLRLARLLGCPPGLIPASLTTRPRPLQGAPMRNSDFDEGSVSVPHNRKRACTATPSADLRSDHRRALPIPALGVATARCLKTVRSARSSSRASACHVDVRAGSCPQRLAQQAAPSHIAVSDLESFLCKFLCAATSLAHIHVPTCTRAHPGSRVQHCTLQLDALTHMLLGAAHAC